MKRLIWSCAAVVMCAMAIGSAPVAAQGAACDSPCKLIPLPLVGRPGAVCDSPCKLQHLPLIQRNDQPVPTSNPLEELQGKVREGYQDNRPAIRVPGSVWPAYPYQLKAEKIEGEVVATFVVDTLGVVDPNSLKILKATHPLFAASVRDALPQMRFIPAEINGVKVSKLVRERYVFSLPY